MAAGSIGVFATDEKIGSLLDQSITRHYMSLDQGSKVCAEYVWIGGTMADMRSKSRTLEKMPTKPEVSRGAPGHHGKAFEKIGCNVAQASATFTGASVHACLRLRLRVG